MKKWMCAMAMLSLCVCSGKAARVNEEKTITVNGVQRKYVLYVPDNVAERPAVVFSLHGASGHSTDRSPFRTTVADQKGCIVVYPQGELQAFPVFGGNVTGWDASGEPNGDLDFFKGIVEEVAAQYDIDRLRIYCCGFSNGGMMTYANAASAAGFFAAFASISGFPLNEFHHRLTGERPVPFLHIHGKADGFVKYSCMPVIRDNMVARNGCNPVPEVTVVPGKYRRSIYESGEGGFPYVYYEIDDMGHSDYTDRTADGNSALTMWNFMSRYTLDAPCDRTLRWRLNIDAKDFVPEEHGWTVNSDRTRFTYGLPKKANNADNNVYPSLQFGKGDYTLGLETAGTAGNKIYIKVESLDGKTLLFCRSGEVGEKVVMPFTVEDISEYKITIVKTSADDRFTAFAFHSCEAPADMEHCKDDVLPEPPAGHLIEIAQEQGKQYDDFARTSFVRGEDYNTYTAEKDLQIAFKMMDVDVKDCDYVLVRFAEPVAAGWKLAFWEDITLADVPEGTTEYKFELEPSMLVSGVLPQICLMTFFGGYEVPLVAKVEGVYKHSTVAAPSRVGMVKSAGAVTEAYYSLSGRQLDGLRKGINIVRVGNETKKVLVK